MMRIWLSLAFAVLLAAPAQAALVTATVSQPVHDDELSLRFVARAGERNDVVVSARGARVIVLRDRGARLRSANALCRAIDAHTVRCPLPANAVWDTLTAELGDRDDRATVRLGAAGAPGTELYGGAGNDLLSGGGAIVDHPGVLDGGAGDDVLRGGPEPNRLDGGPGDDAIAGGRGHDLLDYSRRERAVTVDLAAHRGGARGEHDRLSGIEDVAGGSGHDRLAGDDHDNGLSAGNGGSVLLGRGGADTLRGGTRADDLHGGRGDDAIAGGGPGTVRDGGSGNDRLEAGAGVVRGGPGNDLVTEDNAGDGRPSAVSCGGGHDTVAARQSALPVAADCERLARTLLAASARVRATATALELRVTCRDALPCDIVAGVRAGDATFAERTLQIPGRRTVTVRLARRSGRARPRAPVTVTVKGVGNVKPGASRRYVRRETISWRTAVA